MATPLGSADTGKDGRIRPLRDARGSAATVEEPSEEAPYIVFGKPAIEEAEIREVVHSLRIGWIGTGPKVAAFEESMARYQGAEHAIATNSCTAALHLSLRALGIGPGDEVVVPTLTFCATANVVLNVGARPVLADVDPRTRCIGPEHVERVRTPRTRAVIPVHFAGWPAPMSDLRTLADRHGLAIVQDAAHCVEGRVDGTPPSRFGDLTCFSFYATKNVVTGEGGMVVTDDEAVARRARVLSLHGLDADAWKRFSDDGYRHYECVEPGFKYNMMDLQAALGLHQLARAERNLGVRARQWTRYQRELRGLPLELPPDLPSDIRHARHLYTVLVRPDAPLDRDALMGALHRVGIGTGVHYRPVHEHAHYRKALGHRPEDFPVASDVGRRTLSLPLGPALTPGEQGRVIEALHDILG